MEGSRTTTAGALFGAALAASGVYLPSTIISQMRLTDFHMVKVFLAASASSAFIFTSFSQAGYLRNKPRPPSSLGFFSRYDGNILGGTMVGLGMALTGACPGTVLVQLATGVRSGWYTMAGGVVGGILYARFSGSLQRYRPSKSSESSLTVYGMFDIDRNYAVLVYEVFCSVLIGVVLLLEPSSNSVSLHPLLGGALIGAAQAASLLLTGDPVGVSTGYEVTGTYFWRTLGTKFGRDRSNTPPLPLKSIYFAVGIVAGSWTLTHGLPFSHVDVRSDVSALRGIVGGLVMVFGARIAGGCTSGHGISGMSMLSVASLITVASMFLGGFGAALFI